MVSAIPETPAKEEPKTKRELTSRLLTLILLGLSLLPLFYLIVRVRTIGLLEIQAILFRAKTADIIINTLALAIVVALVTLLIGTLFASLLFATNMSTQTFSGRVLLAISVLPLAIPSYVFTYCWIAIWPNFRGFWAAALVLTLSTMPYILLATVAALRRIDRVQIDVARSLGSNRLEVFTQVIFPQVRNSIAASTLLVILYVLSDFGAVSLLGVDTFTRSIQNLYRASFDRQSAALLGLILVVVAAILVIGEERLQRKNLITKSAHKLRQETPLLPKNSAKIMTTFIISLYSLVALAVPFYLLISRFLGNFQGIDFTALRTATINTIAVSTLGAVIAVLFALPLAATISAGKSRLGLIAEKTILISHALPGVVLGLSLVAFAANFSWLYQSVLLLALAYSLLFLAKGVGSTRSSLERVPTGLKEVSATLGLSPLQTLRRVTLPLAAPGVGLGFLLILLTAMKELPATLILRPTGFETLAIEIWSAASINRFNEAAPFALTLVLIAAIPTFILSRPDRIDNPATDTRIAPPLTKEGELRDIA